MNTLPENAAYVIYTSGSTGVPKGVTGLHRNTVNRMHWMWETYPFDQGEVCCQKTALSFVDSVWETFGALLQGIRTVIVPAVTVTDPHELIHKLGDEDITRLVLVPSLLRAILDSEMDLRRQLPLMKFWTSSGEALPVDLCKRARELFTDSMLVNLYGSSEVAADVTHYAVSKVLGNVPIGRPIANTQSYILSDQQHVVPIGVRGELHIGGEGLARGYCNEVAQSAEKFVPNPFGSDPGARLYRTGDLTRYLPDGNIEYLGRADHQVKVRGFRIELGEIETVLSRHPAVQEAVVVAREGKTGDRGPGTEGIQLLVAYVVFAGEASPGVTELRHFLKAKLPDYMVPAAFVFLAALPLTPSGKVHLRALPDPEVTRPSLEKEFVAPRTSLEESLAGIWREVLGVERVGVHDSFFDLGGHSLLAVQLISRVRNEFQIELPLRPLFEKPTIEGLAEIIEDVVWVGQASTDESDQGLREEGEL